MDGVSAKGFKVLATIKCGGCGCGCPTVLEADDGALVVVGKLDSSVAASDAVKRCVGEGELAVVIPKELLLRAAKSLA